MSLPKRKKCLALPLGLLRRWPVNLEGVATSSYGKKRPRQSPSDKEAQKDRTIILVESLDLASTD